MNRKHQLANAILWAAAIVAAAIMHAPEFLTFALLPVLAGIAVVTTWSKAGAAKCKP